MNGWQTGFRRELDGLGSWKDRADKIESRKKQTEFALASRQERLLALRPAFDALTLDFWKTFGQGLGHEDPAQTIAACRAKIRSPGHIAVLGSIVFVTVLLCSFWHNDAPLAVIGLVAGTSGIAVIIAGPRRQLAHAHKVAAILAREQQPFWLTGGSIALSNLSTAPPAQAKWWWTGRIAIVFVRHLAVRCAIDAFTGELIWQDPLLCAGGGNELFASRTSEILTDLLQTQRYRQMVDAFNALAGLENDITFLASLKAEAEAELIQELREVEQRAQELRTAQQRAAEASQPRSDERQGERQQPEQSKALKASWDTLVIPKSLREKLQAYCRILRDYRGYQAVGVKLPKGMLLYGPPGCGKTEIAKTLSAEAGLNFVALSTADCKVGWIGHAAAKIKEVFIEARAKQPALIFVDELDAVCPIRGAYHDCISQEVTAQLLQEIDGLLSDSQAIFLVGATNRPDQVDSAILSRFSEQIEIPLPDANTRAALLELFLSPLPFCGDKTRLIRRLALDSAGKSGRDLRAVVNQGVLSGVKRCRSPKEFSISEADFALS